ncbi:MAG: helix-turn-helix domain-containing protein [Bacillota bacterium]
MLNSYVNHILEFTDIDVYECGTEAPAAPYGPSVWDHYVLHYIFKGKGTVHAGIQVYSLQAGQGFLTCPGVTTRYEPDAMDPWCYSWVGFYGIKAETLLKNAGLHVGNPVFDVTGDSILTDCFFNIIAAKKMTRGKNIRMVGLIYVLLSRLIEKNKEAVAEESANRKETYLAKMKNHIEKNYMGKIDLTEFSRQIGITRRYLSVIFKEYFNTSPQNYITHFRINRACEMMANKTLPIKEISRSVGYGDPLFFSRIFKKIKNFSPRAYRKIFGARALPVKWRGIDVGENSTIEGSANYQKGIFFINGSGVDIWGERDQFHFVYIPVDGDCVLMGRVLFQQQVSAWSKAGLMFRENLQPDSKYTDVVITPGYGVNFQGRRHAGECFEYARQKYSPPVYLKLVRSGSEFSAFCSKDGAHWEQVGNKVHVKMAGDIYAGLAVTSHEDGIICTAIIDKVEILLP